MIEISFLYPLLFGVLILALVWKWKRPSLPYPPGPKGYPILGNALDLNASVPIWEDIASLANHHDTDVLYLRLLGQDVVVLSSNEAIADLVEKRSGIYADRPRTTMMKLTWEPEWSFGIMPYGAPWRARRRLCNEAFNTRLTRSFDNHQYKYVHRLLSRLLEGPECPLKELESTPGAIMLSITYGIDIESVGDRFLDASTEVSHAIAAVIVPGKFLVDVIPILRYIPDWFPGTGFKVLAKEVRKKFDISLDGPLEYLKNAMKSGEGISRSVTSDRLCRLEEDGQHASFDEEVLRDVSGVMSTAAAETIRSTLKMFFFAMIVNPGAMKKAQEELDRVVGKEELPNFSHKADLPYIDALVKELLRWSPPFPIGIPNRVMQNDFYRGYLIPEGATVIQNIWAIFRDPNIYPDPETFNPDRFLKDGKINPLVLNPEDRVFGAGRRICPGRHLALRTSYLVVACVLSVFDIGPVLDEDGNPQIPKIEFESTAVRSPKIFECAIKPRSEGAIKLVKEIWDSTNC